MVRHPWPFMKIDETPNPISFQLTEIGSFSSDVIPPSMLANSLSRQLTKSDGVTPSFDCDLIEVTREFAISCKASASATCSLGF